MPSQWWTYESEDTIRKRKAAQFERDAKAQSGPNPPTQPPPTPKGPATGPGAASNFERYAKDALLGVTQPAGATTLGTKPAPFRAGEFPVSPQQQQPLGSPALDLRRNAVDYGGTVAKRVEEGAFGQATKATLGGIQTGIEASLGEMARYGPGSRYLEPGDLYQAPPREQPSLTVQDIPRRVGEAIEQDAETWRRLPEPLPGVKGAFEMANPIGWVGPLPGVENVNRARLVAQAAKAKPLRETVGELTGLNRMAEERGSLLVPGGEPTPKGEVPTPSEGANVPAIRKGPFNEVIGPGEFDATQLKGNDFKAYRNQYLQSEYRKNNKSDVNQFIKAVDKRWPIGDVIQYWPASKVVVREGGDANLYAFSGGTGEFYLIQSKPLAKADVVSRGAPPTESAAPVPPTATGPEAAAAFNQTADQQLAEMRQGGQAQPSESAAIPSESGAQPSELTREVPTTDLTPPVRSTGELPAAGAGPSPASAMQAAPDEAPKVAPVAPVSAAGPALLRTEAPTRTLPPFQDNELKPLSKYTDTLYREIGGEDAGIYIPTDATRLDLAREEVYLSNSPDLALGQGGNKGILLEFDAGDIQGQISGAKPTWQMLWEQGDAEFIGRYNQQKVYRDALRAVTVKADATMPKPAKARLKMSLSALEQQGWTKSANPDGSLTYRRPAASEGIPPAVARPEPAAFTEPAPVAAAEPATVAAVDETPTAAAPTAVAPEAPIPAQPGAPTPPVPPRPTTTGATPPIGPRERAGNILLEKHPEDIRDVLAYTHDEQPVAMEEARRGVRPDVLVKADAEALEGMVGSKIKNWKAGDIWNAETILAARLALEKAQRETLQLQRAVVGGDNSTEALVRFQLALARASDMQKAVQGVTAELGRGLRQFTQEIPASPDQAAFQRILEQMGGREWTENLAKQLAQIDTTNPVAVANFIRNVQKPGLWDYVMEMRYNNMLSGAATQVVNSISNAATAMSAPIERGLAATVEVPLALAQRRPRARFFHEVPAEAVGLVRGIPEGVRRALFIIRHGYGYEDLTRTELSHPEAFKGALGHTVNLMGSRWMRAADALFRSINYSGAYNAEAYRLARREGLKGQALAERMADLLTNPTPELMQRSADTAAYRVYQQRGGVATQALMDLRNKAKLGGVPVLKLAIPFVQTPVNLTKYGLERSPLGILNPDLTRAVRRGDPAASDMLGRWVAGMAIAAPLAIYAWQGKITGRAPTDRNERDRFYREGKQPYSLKIGDQWHSYQRAEPFNQTFTQVAALVNAFEKTGEAPTTLVADVGLTIARNLFSQSYMEGLGDFLDALEDYERYGGRYLERLATSFLPASSALRTATRITDPVIREPKGLGEALEANIPGLSENVPAKLNVFGQEAKRETPWWSPYAVTTAKSNRVDTELARLGIEVGGVTDTIGKVKLSREQGVAYRQQAGQMTETGLKVLVLSKYYQEADDEAKARAIRYVTAKTHDLARENVATTLPGGERAGQGPRFTEAELRLRSLDYLSAWLQYQAIPKYAGMDAKEAEVADQHARKVRALARERNVPDKAALAYYSRIDPEGTELAYRVMRQGTNPQRTAFRRAHPELTGYIDEDLAERAAAMPEVPSTEVLQQIAAGVR